MNIRVVNRVWRVFPQNYILLGIMHDKQGKPFLYTDHAIGLDMLKEMKHLLPKWVYKLVGHVLLQREMNQIKPTLDPL